MKPMHDMNDLQVQMPTERLGTRKYIGAILTAIAAVKFLPGCPNNGIAMGQDVPDGVELLGQWIFSYEDREFDVGIEFLPDGTASSFAAPDSFGPAELTWEVDGTEFTMRASSESENVIFAGRVLRGGKMTGAAFSWEPRSPIGVTWTAVKQ